MRYVALLSMWRWGGHRFEYSGVARGWRHDTAHTQQTAFDIYYLIEGVVEEEGDGRPKREW